METLCNNTKIEAGVPESFDRRTLARTTIEVRLFWIIKTAVEYLEYMCLSVDKVIMMHLQVMRNELNDSLPPTL